MKKNLASNPQDDVSSFGSISSENAEKMPLMSRKRSSNPEYGWNLSCGMIPWLQDLEDKIGYKLLVMMFFVEHCLKGFVSHLTEKAMLYIFASYNVEAALSSIYTGIVRTPLALAPIIGLVSDLVPVCGYNKMPYMLLASSLGCGAYLCVGFLPQGLLPITFVVICLFCAYLQFSTCYLLEEATYSKKIREIPQYGPNIVSYIQFGTCIAGMIGVLSSGAIIAAFSEKAPYRVAFVPAFLVMCPIMMNYLQEVPVSPEEIKERRAQFYKQKQVCCLSVIMLVCAGTSTVTGLVYSDPVINFQVAGITFVAIIGSFTLVLSPKIAAFSVYTFLQASCNVSTRGAAFYFMTDDEEQYPEGPHLSVVFYNSVLGTASNIVSMISVVIYQKYATTWRYRSLLLVSNVLIGLFGMLDAILFARLNTKIGIPDTAFVFGTNACDIILLCFHYLPTVIIFAYLCPRDMEATMYALLGGCLSLGEIVSANFGAFLLHCLDIHPDGSLGESDQFRNLWKAALIASTLPLVPVVLLFKLVPNVAQGDQVADVGQDATTGSLLNNWLGH